jgi:PAS domain S-box-containing protein
MGEQQHQHPPQPSHSHQTVSTTTSTTQGHKDNATPERAADRGPENALAATLATQMGHLLDALPDGVVIADDDGYLQLVNQQTAVLFGYDREALLGQPVEALMPARFRTAHPTHRAHYAAQPHLRPMGSGLPLFGLRQDGTEFPIEISLSPIAVAGTPLVLGTIRDVTAQRLLEQHARDELTGRLVLLQAVLDELPVGVYLARGHDAELILANRQVADIWGAQWSAGQPLAAFLAACGTRVYDLQGRALAPEQLATLRALRGGQSVRQHQEVIRHADGSALSVLVHAIALDPKVFPHLNLSGEHIRPQDPAPLVLVVHEDVSGLKDAERLKDEFVALAAHELRTPIAVLLGHAQLLIQAAGPRMSPPVTRRQRAVESDAAAQSGSATEREIETGVAAKSDGSARDVRAIPTIPREWQDEAVTAVMESSRRLATLTDDLLDATRLQANRLELRLEPMELGALVRRVVKRMQVTTAHHHLAVSVPAEPVLVEADVRRVEQVVVNLLSNAIKYSPDGGPIAILLGVHAAPAITAPNHMAPDDDGRVATPTSGAAGTSEWAQVAVRDPGMGIPAEQYDRIFVRFGRADNIRKRDIAGSGLGLFLCRELLERQGGRIWFESAEGVGTTFTFELPCWTEPE